MEEVDMGFVKTYEEILANVKPTADFYNAEMLNVFWETDPVVVKKLLPAPLEPADHPMAMAFVAWYPATNFDVTYRETALFIMARFGETEGSYCLSMSVTNDMAMAAGREMFGFPKKMADIHYNREGNTVKGWAERRDVRFMEISATLDGEFNSPDAAEFLMKRDVKDDGSFIGTAFNFKYFPAPEGGAFDYQPRLVTQETVFRPKEILFGKGSLKVTPSPYDPWDDVPVARMLGALYTRGNNSMLGGKVAAESDVITFIPHAFLKWDMKLNEGRG
jgi:acetoacetate decarboxylase